MRGMLAIQEYILSQVLTEQVPLYCGLCSHLFTSTCTMLLFRSQFCAFQTASNSAFKPSIVNPL